MQLTEIQQALYFSYLFITVLINVLSTVIYIETIKYNVCNTVKRDTKAYMVKVWTTGFCLFFFDQLAEAELEFFDLITYSIWISCSLIIILFEMRILEIKRYQETYIKEGDKIKYSLVEF